MDWGRSSPSVRRVYVFGSRAKGTATSASDLDLALVLDEGQGNQLSELITNSKKWKEELTHRLGLTVKDIYLADDPHSIAYAAVRDHGILIYDRDADAQ